MKMITLISCPLSLHGFPSRWEGGKDANEGNVDAISETWGVSVVCRCQYFKLLSFPVGGTRWAETDVQVSSVLRYCLGARFLGKSASMTQPFTVQFSGSFFLASQRAWRASETFSNLSLPLSLFGTSRARKVWKSNWPEIVQVVCGEFFARWHQRL